jgi:hypothetical protein
MQEDFPVFARRSTIMFLASQELCGKEFALTPSKRHNVFTHTLDINP